jgi:L-threonylcarbamoyladenylate synthase
MKNGGVVAYPTESCYGFGCNPLDSGAVRRILRIKQREWDIGLILIADHYSRLRRYVAYLPDNFKEEILESWPGPFTWVLPARGNVSRWLRGRHSSIAVRVTAHDIARSLSAIAGIALVSTSANRSGRPSAKTAESVDAAFGNELDCIVVGRIGNRKAPSTIKDI